MAQGRGEVAQGDLCSRRPPLRLEEEASEFIPTAFQEPGRRAEPTPSISLAPVRPVDYRHLFIGLGAAAGILALALAWIVLRWLSASQGGVYKTHEGEPNLYLSPDNSATGLVPQKREWFI